MASIKATALWVKLGQGIAVGALLLLLVCFPLLREAIPFFSTTPSVRILCGGLELIFVFGVILARELVLPDLSKNKTIVWVVGGWLFWSMSATLFADHAASALVRQAEWFLHILFGMVLWGWLYKKTLYVRYVVLLIVGGFLLYGCLFLHTWHGLFQPELMDWVHGMPGFTNVRHFAYYAACVTVLSYAILAEEGRARLSVIFFSGICWGFLLWTGARASIFSVIAALTLATLLWSGKRKEFMWVAVSSFSLGLLFSSLYQVSSPYLGVQRISDTTQMHGLYAFSSRRTGIWQECWSYVTENFFFGGGPDSFLYLPRRIDLWITHPHEIFVQASLDWGVIGALLFIGLLGGAFLYALKWHLKRTCRVRLNLCALLAAMVLCLISLVDGSLYHAHSTMLLMVLLAIALQPLKDVQIVKNQVMKPLAFLGGVCGIVLSLHAVTLYVQYKGVPPASPWAQVVRIFPSSLDQLARWAGGWRNTYPEEAIDWLHWGKAHARFSELRGLYLFEGSLLVEQGRVGEGRKSLESALALSHTERELRIAKRELMKISH